jgi:hypothetical protein
MDFRFCFGQTIGGPPPHRRSDVRRSPAFTAGFSFQALDSAAITAERSHLLATAGLFLDSTNPSLTLPASIHRNQLNTFSYLK